MDSEATPSWKKIVPVFAGAAVVGIVVWAVAGRDTKRIEAPAVCVAEGCGYEGAVKVGDTPGQEEWPRECPKCHQKTLYMAKKCPRCGKLLPFKDPKADRFGTPANCPSCGEPGRGT